MGERDFINQCSRIYLPSHSNGHLYWTENFSIYISYSPENSFPRKLLFRGNRTFGLAGRDDQQDPPGTKWVLEGHHHLHRFFHTLWAPDFGWVLPASLKKMGVYTNFHTHHQPDFFLSAQGQKPEVHGMVSYLPKWGLWPLVVLRV